MTDSETEVLDRQRKQLRQEKDTPYIIGKYEVSSLCIETNPCKHYVTDTSSGETYIMGKTNIFLLCRYSTFLSDVAKINLRT
jgi:hypothetical protein